MVRREERSPLYDGVVRGSGGRAGGKFLWTNDDESPSSVVNAGVVTGPLSSYIALSGEAGNYTSTPDSPAFDFASGAIEIVAKVRCNDLRPSLFPRIVCQDSGGLNYFTSSWYLLLSGLGIGTLQLYCSNGESSFIGAASTVAFDSVAVEHQDIWVKANLLFNNGSGSRVGNFYTSSNGADWTQLGATVTNAGVITFFNTAVPVTVGGNIITNATWDGRIYYVEVRNGIDGPVVSRFDPATDATLGGESFTSSTTGEVWTVNVPRATIELASSASSVDGAYDGYMIEITGGTGAGQNHQRIISYDGGSRSAYLSGQWITTPDSTSQYRIVNRGY